jgi:nucleotide-binding universal stress UspA family protein
MLPVRTILHPTDFSRPAQAACEVAAALARDCRARLVVLHVTRPPLASLGGMPAPPPLPVEFDREGLEEQLRRVGAAGPADRPECRLEYGEPAAGILRVASECAADLIVVGTHGRTGLGRLLMGSVAEQVVRKAPCPVVTVKAPPA